MTQLSDQQLAGIDKIRDWHAGHSTFGNIPGSAFGADVFRLFGYAGTGKTTMAKEIPAALGLRNVRYGTFTGKAAHVLRSKGAQPVSTIHSAIYFPTTSLEAKAELAQAREELADLETLAEAVGKLGEDDPGRHELVTDAGWADVMEFGGALDETRERIPELEAAAKRMSWEWNPDSEWASADLIILDEVSMVNAKLATDIEAYGVPILVLGDPAQLPPVEGGGYYTNATPDHLLTEIHRSALDNPITAMATRVRESTSAGLGLTMDDMTPASIRHAMEHDQVLVWSNKRRWAMVKQIRALLGRPDGQVVAGDRIMCLTNNKDLAVFNGQQFEVLAAAPGTLGPSLTLRTEEGREVVIPVFAQGFEGREAQDQIKASGVGTRGGRMLATFSQVITVHKAQGSEWPRVYVVNETPAMMSMERRNAGAAAAIARGREWLYTAVTRAQESVTITAPR
jgi:exodeoxyribonuclease V